MDYSNLHWKHVRMQFATYLKSFQNRKFVHKMSTVQTVPWLDLCMHLKMLSSKHPADRISGFVRDIGWKRGRRMKCSDMEYGKILESAVIFSNQFSEIGLQFIHNIAARTKCRKFSSTISRMRVMVPSWAAPIFFGVAGLESMDTA